MLLNTLFTLGTVLALQITNRILTRLSITASHSDLLVSQITSTSFQGLLIEVSFYSLYIGSVSETIPCCLFGYFIYDLINLCTKPFGKTMYEIHIHHIAVLSIMFLIKTFTHYSLPLLVQLIIILESSSFMLNIMNICKQYIHQPVYSRILALVNLFVYGITRCILFPVWIYYYSFDGELTVLKGFLILVFVLGNIAFVVWFYKLLSKYLKK